jgi:broad specificity phosphatase PhoE
VKDGEKGKAEKESEAEMRVEIRRHSKRQQGEKHLNQEGVSLARKVGNTMGDFAQVVTSSAPRAFETAIAMGYAVSGIDDAFGIHDGAAGHELEMCKTWGDIQRGIKKGIALPDYAKQLRKAVMKIVDSLHNGEAALVISHGGVIELVMLACLPDADTFDWGDSFGFCEGGRLTFEKGQCRSVEILRVR